MNMTNKAEWDSLVASGEYTQDKDTDLDGNPLVILYNCEDYAVAERVQKNGRFFYRVANWDDCTDYDDTDLY